MYPGFKVEWPDNARAVVMINVSGEEGSEYGGLSRGDLQHESMGPIPPIEQLDKRDFISESWFDFGGRVGGWRVLDMLEKYDVKATFWYTQVTCEKYPELTKEIVKRGNELAFHGYRWVEPSGLSREEEREWITNGIAAFKRIAGVVPLGSTYRSDRRTPYTWELLAEHGFVWNSDDISQDIPFIVNIKGKKLVIIPYDLVTNDIWYIGHWNNPLGLLEYLKAYFKYLYESGSKSPGMMTFGIHPRIMGRMSALYVLDEFIKYVKSFPNVWMPRRIEVAKWWLEHYPDTVRPLE